MLRPAHFSVPTSRLAVPSGLRCAEWCRGMESNHRLPDETSFRGKKSGRSGVELPLLVREGGFSPPTSGPKTGALLSYSRGIFRPPPPGPAGARTRNGGGVWTCGPVPCRSPSTHCCVPAPGWQREGFRPPTGGFPAAGGRIHQALQALSRKCLKGAGQDWIHRLRGPNSPP